MTAHHLLSIDPGTRSGWALWRLTNDAAELVAHDRRSGVRVVLVDELLAELEGEVGSWAGQPVVVEGQWYVDPRSKVGKRSGAVGFSSVQAVVESRCWWTAAAELRGADVEVASPGTWIRAMTRGLPGKEPKQRVVQAAKLRWPELRLRADEVDAVLLGAWWAEERGRRAVWNG